MTTGFRPSDGARPAGSPSRSRPPAGAPTAPSGAGTPPRSRSPPGRATPRSNPVVGPTADGRRRAGVRTRTTAVVPGSRRAWVGRRRRAHGPADGPATPLGAGRRPTRDSGPRRRRLPTTTAGPPVHGVGRRAEPRSRRQRLAALLVARSPGSFALSLPRCLVVSAGESAGPSGRPGEVRRAPTTRGSGGRPGTGTRSAAGGRGGGAADHKSRQGAPTTRTAWGR